MLNTGIRNTPYPSLNDILVGESKFCNILLLGHQPWRDAPMTVDDLNRTNTNKTDLNRANTNKTDLNRTNTNKTEPSQPLRRDQPGGINQALRELKQLETGTFIPPHILTWL